MICDEFVYEDFREATQEEKEAQLTALVRRGETAWMMDLLTLYIGEITQRGFDEYHEFNGEDQTYGYHIGGALWALAVGMSGALKEVAEGRMSTMHRMDA